MSIRDKSFLVIDDDPNVCDLIRLYFEHEGARVTSCYSGAEAMGAFERLMPDMVILDLMLPGKDGYSVCRELRARSDVPIIILTARDGTLDKVTGLRLGADDYVEKPFEAEELVARAHAILRRVSSDSVDRTDQTVVLDGLLIDKPAHAVEVMGTEIYFLPKELDLLYFLPQHVGEVFSRDQLLEHVFERFYMSDRSRTGHRGSGLGLNIAQSILRHHGQAIRATASQALGGAAFIFTLDRIPEKESV